MARHLGGIKADVDPDGWRRARRRDGFLRSRSIVRRMLADVDQATSDRAMESVRDALASHADRDGTGAGGVRLNASVWLVTARR